MRMNLCFDTIYVSSSSYIDPKTVINFIYLPSMLHHFRQGYRLRALSTCCHDRGYDHFFVFRHLRKRYNILCKHKYTLIVKHLSSYKNQMSLFYIIHTRYKYILKQNFIFILWHILALNVVIIITMKQIFYIKCLNIFIKVKK